MRTRDVAFLLLGLGIGIPLAATASLTPDNSGLVIPYRGRIERNGTGANGSHSLRFTLFKAATGGASCAGPITQAVNVVGGEFSTTITLPGPSCLVDATQGLWLEVSVTGPGESTPVSLNGGGRQRIHATPFAMASAPSSSFILQGNAGNMDRAPTSALHVERAWGTQTDPSAGLGMLYNTSNTANAHATLGLRVAGPAAGNPFVSFDVANEQGWAMGVDNADGNRFKISPDWSTLASPAVSIATNRAVSMAGDLAAAGNVTAGTSLTVGSMTFKRTCAAGWTSVNIGVHSSLCILRQPNSANYRGQSDFCRGTHNAQLCTFTQLQLACGAGFALTADTTLADRIRDDTHLYVNGTDCNNFDGESAYSTVRPAGYCCIQ